ncbi:hypothetical protein TGARI_275740C, partial [Toxoplasma gondii ARI]
DCQRLSVSESAVLWASSFGHLWRSSGNYSSAGPTL